jgi:hypothetical protein
MHFEMSAKRKIVVVRNELHSIWSPNASEITSNMFAKLLFAIFTDGLLFGGVSVEL